METIRINAVFNDAEWSFFHWDYTEEYYNF